MEGILGKKVGMTQIFDDAGTALPVTVVEAGPCLIVQRKTQETDGYDAVQMGLVEERSAKNVTQPMQGHFQSAGVPPMRRLAEFQLSDEEESEWKPGDQVKVSLFAVDDLVDVSGVSKGKGFQGVIKRHGFSGGGATHGSMFHRAPGSIGQAADPSRVFPGMRAPGQMGAKRITTKNLRVMRVDEERNLLYLKGAVPGPRGGYLTLLRSRRG